MEFMFLPLKRYAEFSGRSRRMEFWMWLLFQFLLGCAFLVAVIGLAGSTIIGGNTEQVLAGGIGVIGIVLLWLLVSLAFFIPNLAVTIRRLHDTGRSGWWVMLYWGPALANNFLTPAFGNAAANGNNLEAVMGVAMLFTGASLIGSLVLLVFMFLDGTPGSNRYGLDPKGRADAGNVFA